MLYHVVGSVAVRVYLVTSINCKITHTCYTRLLLHKLVIIAKMLGTLSFISTSTRTAQVVVLAIRGQGVMDLSGEASSGGGVQQRLKRARDETLRESKLATFLLEETAWGHVSPVFLNKICRLAAEDVAYAVGCKDPSFKYQTLETLGALGSSGGHTKNVWSELVRVLQPSKFSGREKMLMPMKTNIVGLRYCKQLVADPHCFFAEIYTYYPEVICVSPILIYPT